MKRSARLVALLALGAIAVLPLATAHAHPGVVAFQGQATLGAAISFPVCTSGGAAKVCDPPSTTWALTAIPAVNPADRCVDVGVGAPGLNCAINMDGQLTAINGGSPSQGLGPWCGASGGTTVGGTAPDTLTTTAGAAHLVDARWITSAGTVLPLTGTYSGHASGQTVILTRSAAGPPPTADPVGSLTATTTQCLAGTASSFGVIGVTLSS